MATRFVYKPKAEKPFVECVPVDFLWEKGMALSQKRKSALNLHAESKNKGIATNLLECSRAGWETLGTELSAFNLPYFGNTSMAIENVYQGSKVFQDRFTSKIYWLSYLYNVAPMEAKKAYILTSKDYNFLGFKLFETGIEFPKSPRYIFYNYIYIKSLMAHISESTLRNLMTYDGFTDTMLRWYKGKVTSCQAHAIAMCLGMLKAGTYNYHMSGTIEQYMELYN